MIQILNDFKIKLDFDSELKYYTIYSYQRIFLQPQAKQHISLPYKRKIFNGYLKFELDKSLAEKGLLCLWNNLNEIEGGNNLIFLLSNNNIILQDDLNALTRIIGTNKNIDIIPGSVIGKIFL